MSTAFGVHIGNSSACIAVSKDGKTDVVANDAGDRVTPAVVGYTDTEIVVGLAAKQGIIRNPSNTILNNKRLIGGERVENSPVCLVDKDGAQVYEVDFNEKEHLVKPSEILEKMYAYMHDIAASHCSNVDESNTVISVPLGYSQEQRDLVKSCAAAAGFSVVQVISEPVASCLAHSIEQEQDRRHVLVFRVGGLTTTATLLLVSGGCYSVLHSVDTSLGGNALTNVLVEHLGREFKNKFKEDILTNKKGRAKLAREADNVKHVLSTLDTAHCYIESLFDGMDFSTNVTRARFDNEISKVVNELMSPITELLTKCNLAASDVDHVVLSGGTTKVVKIQKQLSSMFTSAELSLNISPDESIAIGAAVQASYITKEITVSGPTKMMSVSQAILAKSESLAEGGDLVLVHEDSTIPLRRSIPVPVKTGSEEVVLDILFAPDTRLGTLKLPVQQNSKISLGVHIHRDGTSHFTLTDKPNSKSSDFVLKPSSSSS